MSVHLSVDACYHPSHRPLHVRFQPGDSQSEVLNKPASLAPQHPAIARLGSNQRSPRLHKGSRECTPESLARGRSRTPSAQATASYSVSAYQIVYRCRLNTIIQWWTEAEIHKNLKFPWWTNMGNYSCKVASNGCLKNSSNMTGWVSQRARLPSAKGWGSLQTMIYKILILLVSYLLTLGPLKLPCLKQGFVTAFHMRRV